MAAKRPSGNPLMTFSDPPYLPSVGQEIYQTDPEDLPPVTRALRAAWGTSAYPVASSESAAALLVAVHALELRVAALET